MANKKIFAFAALIFVLLLSSLSYAGSSSASDVSIDVVKVNGQVLAESKTNFMQDTNNIDVIISLTAIKDVNNIHVEAILTDLSTGNTIADSSGTFALRTNQSSLVPLSLRLIDSMKRQKDFRLEVRVVDINDNKEQKSFGIKFTGAKAGARKLDVSIDRVRVNDNIAAASKVNFIDRSNSFDFLVEFTALSDLEDAHVEAILKDLKSNTVVADASPNFDIADDSSSSESLSVELLNKMKQSDSFELTIRIIDAEGNSVQQSYGLKMQRGAVADGRFDGRALDISIDSIDIDGKVLAANENNFIVISQGKQELDLRVRLTSLENVKDAHIDAVLSFESGDVVADATKTFNIDKDENEAKTLKIPLVIPFEQASFKLKVKVVDPEGNFEEKLYGLKISQKEFPFVISSIALSPENNAEAGKNIFVKLSFKNSGLVPLEGIIAKVSIPELGISSTKFVDKIKDGNLPEVEEEFIIRVLGSTQTGTYTVRAEITSQFGSQSEVKEIPLFVVGESDQVKQTVNEKLIINIPIASQDIPNDGSEVAYPLTLTNEGPDANSYALLLDGSNWANLRLSESNVFIIKPKKSKTINILASSKGKAKGEQTFFVTIQSGDSTLKQIQLKGNVVSVKGLLAEKLKDLLESALIFIVVALAAIGLFFGIRKLMQGGKGESISEEIPDRFEEGEAYY